MYAERGIRRFEVLFFLRLGTILLSGARDKTKNIFLLFVLELQNHDVFQFKS